MSPRLVLVDTDLAVVTAWERSFRAFPEVRIRHAEILSVARSTVVSPANSFGLMEAGVDRDYVEFFGSGLQERVLEAIHRRPEGFLPVGASVVVATGHSDIPHLVVAPTMFEPGPVPGRNAYSALRAVLRACVRLPEVGAEVYCPGLCTGVGEVRAEEAAEEMAQAYADWRSGGRRRKVSGP